MSKTGKVMLSGGLILVSGAYAWWQQRPPISLPAPVAVRQPQSIAQNKTVAGLPPVAAPPPVAAAPVPVTPAETVTPSQPGTPPQVAQAGPEQKAKAQTSPRQIAAAQPAPPPPEQAPLQAVQLAPQPTVSTGRYMDGEFIGKSSDGQWGPVQVKVVIRNGNIADVICIVFPIHRRRSAEISEWAIPMLYEEAIKAQSAEIDIISQASFTSEEYQASLASALMRASKTP